MRIIGAQPRPRALAYGFEGADDLVARILAIFPTRRRIDSPEDVRQGEWDVLVTDKSMLGFEGHLYVIGVGLDQYGLALREEQTTGYVLRGTFGYQAISLAKEFVVSARSPAVARLVEKYLVPMVASGEGNPVIRFNRYQRLLSDSDQLADLTAFIETTEPETLAASFTRPSGAQVWCLPVGTPDLPAWVTAALSEWHRRDASRFPFDPSWRQDSAWLTDREEDVVGGLEQLDEDRDQLLKEIENRRAKLEARLSERRREAEEYEHALLVGTDDPLVGAVQRSLEELGFEVSNRDQVNPQNDRLEDLWVTSLRDDSQWIAIVEVKSYSKGASVNDLMKLSGRFAKRFMIEQRREPSRLWFIANTFLDQDPSQRPLPLETNPREVEVFGDEGGVVIATTSLFEALKRVRRGEASVDSIRAVMMAAIGRWPTQ